MNEDVRSQIVSDAIIHGCQFGPSADIAARTVCQGANATHIRLGRNDDAESVPAITGSTAEFYIQPMMPYIGDFDIMYYFNTTLAIPAGHRPPTLLPAEFGREVTVVEIHDTSLPCYVYLRRKYRLSRDVDNSMYNVSHSYSGLECLSNRMISEANWSGLHGPAGLRVDARRQFSNVQCTVPVPQSADFVCCFHCPVWLPKAAYWPRRDRYHGWPDSATIDRVFSQGCDVVPVSHRCRRDDEYQWRLSFSRAEVILLNSWTPVQQTVYHLLRYLMKTERFTADDSPLSNYHIKTLMLWSCELRPANWWTDSNLIQLCCELLHVLARSLNNEMCQHYFVVDCNLLDVVTSRDPVVQSIVANLQSCTQTTLTTWFIEHYLQPCARRYSDDVGRMFDDVIRTSQLKTAITEMCHRRDYYTGMIEFLELDNSLSVIIETANIYRPTVRMCKFYQSELLRTDSLLLNVFVAAVLIKCYAEIEVSGCLCSKSFDAALVFLGCDVRHAAHPIHVGNLGTSAITRNLLYCKLAAANRPITELAQFLLRSAVERLTAFRQLEAETFSNDERIAVGTTDFEALYAYKCRQYDKCLALSQQIVDKTLTVTAKPRVYIRRMMSVLMDDDIRSVLGLMELCYREKNRQLSIVGQNVLALNLILKCKLKLNYSTESMIESLRQVKVAYSRCDPLADPLSRCLLAFVYRQTVLSVSMLE